MRATLRCGYVIDGTGNDPLEGVDIHVEDGVIRDISPTSSARSNASETIIDLQGLTVLPGLVDAHDHLGFDWTDLKDELVREPDSWAILRAVYNAQAVLQRGITTLRVMGEKNHIDVHLRRAIRAGMIAGPDLIVSGRVLTITAGVQSWFPGTATDDIPAMRKRIREEVQAGVDVIKMFATGSAASQAVGPTTPCFDREQIFFAVQEAQRFGLGLAAHCHGGPSARDLVDAGAHSIEHGAWLDDDVMESMAEKGTYLVFTSGYAHMVAAYPRATPSQRERCQRMIEAYHHTMTRARRMGVRIGIGTDENHGDLVIEMRNLIEAGYQPMEAIQAGTAWNATICGVHEDRGTIEVGKRADIIAVAGDPLVDIDAVGQVRFVMKQGAVCRLDA